MKYFKVVDDLAPNGDLYRDGEDGLEMLSPVTGTWLKSIGSDADQLKRVVERDGGSVTEVEAP
jgi:hypothetical protein